MSLVVCIPDSPNTPYKTTDGIEEIECVEITSGCQPIDCCICFDEIQLQDGYKLPCGHIFHTICVNTWFIRIKEIKCPICVRSYGKLCIPDDSSVSERNSSQHAELLVERNDIRTKSSAGVLFGLVTVFGLVILYVSTINKDK